MHGFLHVYRNIPGNNFSYIPSSNLLVDGYEVIYCVYANTA